MSSKSNRQQPVNICRHASPGKHELPYRGTYRTKAQDGPCGFIPAAKGRLKPIKCKLASLHGYKPDENHLWLVLYWLKHDPWVSSTAGVAVFAVHGLSSFEPLILRCFLFPTCQTRLATICLDLIRKSDPTVWTHPPLLNSLFPSLAKPN